MSFQAEFFVIPSPPALSVRGRPFALSGLAFRRTDTDGQTAWLTLADMPRAQAFDLEGHLIGVRAVDLIHLPVEPPTRLNLAPDAELSALLERSYQAGSMRAGLSPELAEQACRAERYTLQSIEEGHLWDRP